MDDLLSLSVKTGFDKVQTYIASGNVIFSSGKSETKVEACWRQVSRNTPEADWRVRLRRGWDG